MPPKGISKAVSKKCPECKKQNPVATRSCQCGYQFFEERRKSTASNNSEFDETDDDRDKLKASRPIDPNASPATEVKRRSERVKREKPNYYDSLEYDNQMKKARKERQREEQLQNIRVKRERRPRNNSEMEEDDEEEFFKEKRRRKKKKNSNGEKKEEEIDEDIMTGISPEKEWQYSIVLADINLKLGFNNPAFF